MSKVTTSKLNPNAKAFVPTAPKAPALQQRTGHDATSAGKKLDKHDARTATNKSPAHNRSQHVGLSDNALAARNKPVATSFLTKADQNKAAAELLNSTKGKNKISDLKADSDGKTRAFTGPGPSGPGKTGANWNKTASITRVVEKTPTGTIAYNAKATNNKMELAKTGGKVNVQSTYAEKPKGGFVALEKPATGPKVGAPKLGFDQQDYSNVTKNAKKPTTQAPNVAVKPTGPAPKPSWSAVAAKKPTK
jgi:hypothetical protein